MKNITIGSILFILSLCTSVGWAHDGLMDRNGCHTDNDGTNYHCHEIDKSVEVKNGKKDENVKNNAKFHAKKVQTPRFRNHKWGASMADIIKLEGAPKEKSNNRLFFSDKISNVNMHVFFDFHKDSLCSAGYISRETYINDRKHVNDYLSLNKFLRQKYLQPTLEKRKRDNNQFTDISMELLTGELIYFDEWHIGGITINHVIFAESTKVHHGITYKNDLCIEDQKDSSNTETVDKL